MFVFVFVFVFMFVFVFVFMFVFVQASRSHQRDMQESWSADTVLWMSDDGTTECCYCQGKFSHFKRKVRLLSSHCRE